MNTKNTMTKLKSDTSDTAILRMRANIPKYIAGKRVVIFNVWKRTYKDAQGHEKEGITAVFSPLDEPGEYIIGAGSRITLQNEAFDVLDVQPARDDNEAFVMIHPAPR